MFHFRQLEYFITTAETLHIGKAAALLHITQPPLSRQLAVLEDTLGVALFLRHPKGVSLTSAGQQFYDDAKRILRSVEQASANAKLVATGKIGALSIGFMMHAAYNIVPGITRRFMQHSPGVALKLQEVIPAELLTHVLQGKFDGGIMLKTHLPAGITALHICSEKLCLAVHVQHPLAKQTQISASMLSECRFIATPYSVAAELRGAIDSYCRMAGFEPQIVLETQLQQTIVTLVAEELGVALLPEPVAKIKVDNVKFIRLTDSPSVEYVLIWRADNINPALVTFVETVKQLSGTLV